jgi:predicted nuclease of restriction endonuclease-like (RecB) superfamily
LGYRENACDKIANEEWEAKTVKSFARDLKEVFGDKIGFSTRNLHYMCKFAVCYPEKNHTATAAQIPWSHNMVILDKLEDQNQCLWYIQQTIENGCGRNMLEMSIESNLYERQIKAPR